MVRCPRSFEHLSSYNHPTGQSGRRRDDGRDRSRRRRRHDCCGLRPTPSLLALRLRMPPHPTAGVPNFGTPRQCIPIATAASSESGNTVATAPPLSLPRRPPQASRPPLPALSVPGARFAAVVANFHKLPQTYTLVQQAIVSDRHISSSESCQQRCRFRAHCLRGHGHRQHADALFVLPVWLAACGQTSTNLHSNALCVCQCLCTQWL